MSENQEQEQQSGKDLRSQLEAQLEKVKQLEAQLAEGTNAQRELAFRDAGIDTKKGVGKLLAERYDGELDTEAIVSFAKEYDVDIEAQAAPDKTAEPDPTQQKFDQLQSQSNLPGGAGQRMPMNEYLDLTQSDPSAAIKARQDGLVDIPPHVQTQLEANQSQVRLG